MGKGLGLGSELHPRGGDMGAEGVAVDAERLAAVVVELRRTLRRASSSELAPGGVAEDGLREKKTLSDSEQEVMRYVVAHPGVGTRAIAAGLRLRANTVSGVCSALVKAGLLVRNAHPDDARVAQFFPVDEVLQRRKMKMEKRGGRLRDALSGLNSADRQLIADALPAFERLSQQLDEEVKGS